jgi:hypothetical protein
MEKELHTKTITVTKTRVLADGTKKQYQSKQTYKINPNGRAGNSRPEKLSSDQKEDAWKKYCSGVKIKRICEDLGVSYSVVKKVIDEKKSAQPKPE